MQIKSLHKIPDNRKLNVCAYARVSSNKDEQEASLEEQIDVYTSLILENPNWNFAGIYIDDGISGTTKEKRTSFNIMISKALQGQIDIILVKSISRFARNVIDLLTTIQELRDNGIEVYFERENFSSLDYKSDTMLTCYAKFAEEESLSISKNCNWRIQKNYAEGKYYLQISHHLGYRYDENKNIIIYEPEAKWIRKIFEMYVNNYSITEICNMLNQNKVKTVMGKDKWTDTSIRRILVNEKYVGDCLLQKTYVENSLTHKKILNTGERPQYLIQNGHPAIIKRALWNAAQEKRTKNRSKFCGTSLQKNIYTNRNLNGPFTRFAYCPHCHSNYILKANYHNYKEPTKMLICASNKNTRLCPASESLFVETINKIIIKMLNLLNDNQASFKTALTKAFQRDEETNSIEKLKALESDISSLRERYCELASSCSEYHEAIKEELLIELSNLTKEKNILENKILTMETANEKANEVIRELKKIPKNLESLTNINFRSILKRMIVINRNELIFVVGSEDLSHLPKKLVPQFNLTQDYMIRKTRFTCKCGIFINKE